MESDWLTTELKKAFVEINRTAEKQAKREAKKSRKAERRRNLKAVEAAEKLREAHHEATIVRPCSECGKPTKADPEFFLNPVRCHHCKDLSRSIDLGIHPRRSVDFSSVRILQGGAPGLGKRK